MKNSRILLTFLPLFALLLFSNCKNDKLVGTPEVSSTEDVIIVKSFEAPAPTYNDVDYTPTIEHDGLGRVPGVDATTTKVQLSGKWYSATLRTGEAVPVFITGTQTYKNGDTLKVSLREYNEGPALVGPYVAPPVASSTPKEPVVPKGKADWSPQP
jgi:hypothetical protein